VFPLIFPLLKEGTSDFLSLRSVGKGRKELKMQGRKMAGTVHSGAVVSLSL